MKRSTFLKLSGRAAVGVGLLGPSRIFASHHNRERFPELEKHKIEKWETKEVDFHWPRFVGKNGRIDFHGQHKQCTVLKLYTDQGAVGWGLTNKDAEKLCPPMIGKSVAELIVPGKGIVEGLNRAVDFALHDLMGIILEKPVYQLLGANGPRESPIYSGMIYLDELNTVEGVTCLSDDIDYGDYPIRAGKIAVSDAPGFGMKLLK